jgi:hypothetical protein
MCASVCLVSLVIAFLVENPHHAPFIPTVALDRLSRYLEDMSNEYLGAFNPPRDGDCLMRCAVTHDFGRDSDTADDDAARTVAGVSGPSAGVGGSGGGVATKALTANDLRTLVVARVRCNLLAALNDRLSRSVDGRGGGVAGVGGAGMVSVEAYCEAMSRPGVVMGEDELQALADVRQACVIVNSVVCIFESTDFGAILDASVYTPTAAPSLSPSSRASTAFSSSSSPLERGGGISLEATMVGKGDTLVRLQEARAHRMSHFQLLLQTATPSLRDTMTKID